MLLWKGTAAIASAACTQRPEAVKGRSDRLAGVSAPPHASVSGAERRGSGPRTGATHAWAGTPDASVAAPHRRAWGCRSACWLLLARAGGQAQLRRSVRAKSGRTATSARGWRSPQISHWYCSCALMLGVGSCASVPIVLLTCDIHRSFICLLPWSISHSKDNAHY